MSSGIMSPNTRGSQINGACGCGGQFVQYQDGKEQIYRCSMCGKRPPQHFTDRLAKQRADDQAKPTDWWKDEKVVKNASPTGVKTEPKPM